MDGKLTKVAGIGKVWVGFFRKSENFDKFYLTFMSCLLVLLGDAGIMVRVRDTVPAIVKYFSLTARLFEEKTCTCGLDIRTFVVIKNASI
jgi:hypothetical protein